MTYLENNRKYWEKGYYAPNSTSILHRLQGRILKHRFGLPEDSSKLLDFGCGQGANVNYFSDIGYDVCGIDISEHDLGVAKERYPHLKSRFMLVDPNPAKNDFYGWPSDIDLVVAQQSLYYFSDTDWKILVDKLFDSMKPGAIIYASMIGDKHTFFEYSHPTNDSSLRKIKYTDPRGNLVDNYFVNFTRDEEHLLEKFGRFNCIESGQYMAQIEKKGSNGFHWVFIGQKPK